MTEETRGATFMVADLSAYAVDTFTPTLLPPTVAILGIGRIRPVGRSTAQGWLPTHLMSLSLTIDHLGADDIRAGQFLTRLTERIETACQPAGAVCLN